MKITQPVLYADILNVNTTQQFNEIAIKIFQFQAQNNSVYKKYIQYLKVEPKQIRDYREIPFLPISFFKSHEVKSGVFEPETVFTSSGTTQTGNSKHYIKDLTLYESVFTHTFEQFFNASETWCILALLPSYLERKGSSLIYMVERLMQKSGHPENGFYLDDHHVLLEKMTRLKEKGQRVMLFGVSFALLDFAEKSVPELNHVTIVETGGMKGRRKEMTRPELHKTLKEKLSPGAIFSEYGMTELLSQAYTGDDGLFHTPPWMKIMIREVNDPFSYCSEGKGGGINIIDLANIHSCSFIETEDLGKITNDGFEVMGRFDNSDIRGCNLLVV